MESYQNGATTKDRHHLLVDLDNKALEMLEIFESLPQPLQMDGLDILQGIVNTVIKTITNGRVVAVKFVPEEQEPEPEPEPEADPEPVTPEVKIKQEPVSDDEIGHIESVTSLINPIKQEKPPAEKEQQTIIVPFGHKWKKGRPPSRKLLRPTDGDCEKLWKPSKKRKTYLDDDEICEPLPDNDENKEMFHCPHCSYSVDKQSHLDVHLIVHSKSKDFRCPHCDKKFSASASLKRHIMAHEGDKRYVCRICHKAFLDMAGLRTHVVVHTGC